jgi:hypothetical protein
MVRILDREIVEGRERARGSFATANDFEFSGERKRVRLQQVLDRPEGFRKRFGEPERIPVDNGAARRGLAAAYL